MSEEKNEIAVLEKELPVYAQEAQAFEIITEQDMNFAEEKKKFLKKRISFTKDFFKPMEQKAKDALTEIKNKRDSIINPMEEVVKVYHLKIGDFLDLIEKQKREEAERLAEEQRKEREKELKRINKKLDSFQGKFTDLVKQKEALEHVLNLPDTSQEEAELIRLRIDTIERQLDATTDKAVDTQAQVDNIVDPMPVIPEKTEYDRRSYGTYLEPKIINSMRAIRDVLEGNAPMSIINFNMAVIKKLVNSGSKYVWVACTEKRKGT